MVDATRFDRQKRIAGWDQQAVERTGISILGNTNLAYFTGLPFACAGFSLQGFMNIIGDYGDTAQAPLISRPSWGLDIYGMREEFKFIWEQNKEVHSPNIFCFETRMATPELSTLLTGSDVIIDTTTDPVSKEICLSYAKKQKIPFVSSIVNWIIRKDLSLDS